MISSATQMRACRLRCSCTLAVPAAAAPRCAMHAHICVELQPGCRRPSLLTLLCIQPEVLAISNKLQLTCCAAAVQCGGRLLKAGAGASAAPQRAIARCTMQQRAA